MQEPTQCGSPKEQTKVEEIGLHKEKGEYGFLICSIMYIVARVRTQNAWVLAAKMGMRH